MRFGREASASRLTSERDQNFRMRCGDGTQYVLKISNPAEDPEVTDFQVEALLHLERVAADLPVPRMVPTRSGDVVVHVEVEGGVRSARLLTYLDGVPLNVVRQDERHRCNQGTMLARLGRGLRGFFHRAAGHRLPWDIKHASALQELIACIEEPSRRRLAQAFLDNFGRYAKPQIPKLLRKWCITT